MDDITTLEGRLKAGYIVLRAFQIGRTSNLDEVKEYLSLNCGIELMTPDTLDPKCIDKATVSKAGLVYANIWAKYKWVRKKHQVTLRRTSKPLDIEVKWDKLAGMREHEVGAVSTGAVDQLYPRSFDMDGTVEALERWAKDHFPEAAHTDLFEVRPKWVTGMAETGEVGLYVYKLFCTNVEHQAHMRKLGRGKQGDSLNPYESIDHGPLQLCFKSDEAVTSALITAGYGSSLSVDRAEEHSRKLLLTGIDYGVKSEVERVIKQMMQVINDAQAAKGEPLLDDAIESIDVKTSTWGNPMAWILLKSAEMRRVLGNNQLDYDMEVLYDLGMRTVLKVPKPIKDAQSDKLNGNKLQPPGVTVGQSTPPNAWGTPNDNYTPAESGKMTNAESMITELRTQLTGRMTALELQQVEWKKEQAVKVRQQDEKMEGMVKRVHDTLSELSNKFDSIVSGMREATQRIINQLDVMSSDEDEDDESANDELMNVSEIRNMTAMEVFEMMKARAKEERVTNKMKDRKATKQRLEEAYNQELSRLSTIGREIAAGMSAAQQMLESAQKRRSIEGSAGSGASAEGEGDPLVSPDQHGVTTPYERGEEMAVEDTTTATEKQTDDAEAVNEGQDDPQPWCEFGGKGLYICHVCKDSSRLIDRTHDCVEQRQGGCCKVCGQYYHDLCGNEYHGLDVNNDCGCTIRNKKGHKERVNKVNGFTPPQTRSSSTVPPVRQSPRKRNKPVQLGDESPSKNHKGSKGKQATLSFPKSR